MRLAFVLVIAALMLPRDALKQVAEIAYQHTEQFTTVCQNYPDECQAARKHAIDAGVMMVRVARQASYHMEDGVKLVLANLELARADREPDRGTLNDKDLAPQWRGR